MTQIATLTGLVDIDEPGRATNIERITPRAIAHALARLNRWAGNTELPLTVAQHSLLVRDVFLRLHPEFHPAAIHALLHDGHEYLLGDLTRPLEAALDLRVPGFSRHLAAIKLDADRMIRTKLATGAPTIDQLAAIAEADRLAAAIEWLSFIDASNGECPYGAPPRGLPTRIKALPWPKAEELFLAQLEQDLATLRANRRAA